MQTKRTREDFIDLSRDKHGDKYDYSCVNYVNNITNVEIICPKHGPFFQLPKVHLRGGGCPRCGYQRGADQHRLSIDEFIARSRKVHGNRYDYSKSVYVWKDEPLTIICRRHGEFSQSPNNHMRGQGCPICGVEKRAREQIMAASEAFASKAEAIHGKGTYDYSLVHYKSAKEYVVIICPTHGPFQQSPTSHLTGRGCKTCGFERQVWKQRLTTEQCVERAKKLHEKAGYDYSKVDYKDTLTAVEIVCPTHGSFYEIPTNHLDKTHPRGCPLCKATKQAQRLKLNFITKAKQIHGEHTYDYSEVEYVDVYTPVKVICPKHGPFFTKPFSHTHKTQSAGCMECAHDQQSERLRLTREEFIARAEAVHGKGKYDYSEAEYVDARSKIKIICYEHGPFMQNAGKHMYGSGCPTCTDVGFDPLKPAIVYYLRLDTDTGHLFKIGVTNRTVAERFSRDIDRIKVLAEIPFDVGGEAIDFEREVLQEFAPFRYSGPPVLSQGGNTELFVSDVFEMDESDG